MYFYVSIVKSSETDYIEKLNMLSCLLSNINKELFKISNIYLNIEKHDEDETQINDSIQIILKTNNYLFVEKEEDFVFVLTSERSFGFSKYLAIYQLLENKLKRKNIKIEEIKKSLDIELKQEIELLYKKYKNQFELNKFEDVKFFKGIRHYLVHGNNLDMKVKLRPIINELTKTLIKIVNKI